MKKTLSIVGGGRVGRELGRQLVARGWRVVPVTARSVASARSAVQAIGAGKAYGRLVPEVFDANLLLVTTPDDAIAPVARLLAKMAHGSLRGLVVLHTSGAVGSDALRPLSRLGASVASMHPLQAFGRGHRPDLRGICFAIEGQAVARRLAMRLARQMDAVPVVIRGDAKAAYHAAGSFASPHLLAILEAGTRLLVKGAGFQRKQAAHALALLAHQTLENFERVGAAGAWTGPVARGDRATIRRHERELRRWPREYRQAYRALSRLQEKLLGQRKNKR